MTVAVHHGDSRDVLKTLAENSVASVVTDPPYGLVSISERFINSPRNDATVGKHAYGRHAAGFMGKNWDTGDTAFDADFWREVHRVLKPGAYLIAFGGSRTYHRLVCAIEDAGFIIHPMIGWAFGTGFPKATNLSKQFDRANGAERAVVATGPTVRRIRPGADQNAEGSWEKLTDRTYTHTVTEPGSDEARQWDGWAYGAQSLKPALEPICMAQKPIDGRRMVDNIRQHGVGAVNIDACRIGTETRTNASAPRAPRNGFIKGFVAGTESITHDHGRWPANLVHDGSDEVIAGFPDSSGGHWSGETPSLTGKQRPATAESFDPVSGSASRFFYSAKAGEDDRAGSKHPTVKPVALIRWLVRLVTPPGGTVLDCFAGSGTTGAACIREGFDAVLIEREAEYVADIRSRLAQLSGLDAPLFSGAPS